MPPLLNGHGPLFSIFMKFFDLDPILSKYQKSSLASIFGKP
jgi:hypothetical protein